jgi:hypothetical protein
LANPPLKPSEALKAAKRLIGQWPSTKPISAEDWIEGIARTLSIYPAPIAEQCVDPVYGLAAKRDFPPTVFAVREWCDRRQTHFRNWANYRPAPRSPRIEYVPTKEQRDKVEQGLRDLSQKLANTLKSAAAWH